MSDSGAQRLDPGQTAKLIDYTSRDAGPWVLTWQATSTALQLPPTTTGSVKLRLSWGAGSGAFAATIDARRGGRLCLIGNTVNVEAFYDGTGPAYDVRAMVRPGQIDTPRPTLTVPLGVASLNGAVTTPIPAFADRLMIYPADINLLAGPCYGVAEFVRGEGGSPYAAAMSASFGQVYTRWIVPDGADVLRLRNIGTGVPVVSWLAVWELAL